MSKQLCQGRVFNGFSFQGCSKGAALEHDGKHYCKLHHPPTIRAKREAKQADCLRRYALKQDEQKRAEAEAAEQKRRADLFPELLDALQGLLPGAEAMGWNTDKARAAISKALGEQA